MQYVGSRDSYLPVYKSWMHWPTISQYSSPRYLRQHCDSVDSIMHPCIILLSIAAVVSAADQPIPIISQSQDIRPDGSYFIKWESGNGITFEEDGVLKNAGQKDKEAEEVRGSSSWSAPDGAKYNIRWLANEDGATFEGAHLPTPPPPQPIPVLIQRALDWIAAHPSKDDKDRF